MAKDKIKKVEKRSGKVKPDCFGKYVFAGAKECRVCPWAKDCKLASKEEKKGSK